MASFELPTFIKPTVPVAPFTASIPDSEIENFKTLVKLSKLPSAIYETQHRKYGITAEWMRTAKTNFETTFDWRAVESKINSYPQFIATVDDFKVHFVGVFSSDPAAIPLVLLHGWPGSFYEFYPSIPELQKLSQPFHIIIPSQIGYCFSSRPPLDKNFSTYDAADIVQKLMKGLGLNGYIAAGGDIGSFIARALTHDEACRGCHLNMYILADHEQGVSESTPADEIAALERAKLFDSHGRGYMTMHGTRPATIAHVLASSPVALLAWLAEKFLEWTDADPSTEDILEKVALYWFTETFPSSIYPYREIFDKLEDEEWKKRVVIKKPMGFSWFPFELLSTPIPWVTGDKTAGGNCIWWNKHSKGGHFPSSEMPAEYAQDIDMFVKKLKEFEAETLKK